MRPFTTTGERNNQEDLRRNWRGNRCSKGRNGDLGGKGWSGPYKIGNNNYRRKVSDRPFKKQYRQRLKQEFRRMAVCLT